MRATRNGPWIKQQVRGERLFSRAETLESGVRVGISFSHQPWDAPNTWVVTLAALSGRKAKRSIRRGTYTTKVVLPKAKGLDVLYWALRQLDEFQERHPASILVVRGDTPRKQAAYARLQRHGFIHGEYAGEEVWFRGP